MRRALFLLIIVAMCLSGAQKRRKGPKRPDLEIAQISSHRGEEQISIDGKLRNTGERTFKGVNLFFDFMAPGKQHLTTQSAPVEEEVIEPGAGSAFRVALDSPPRAVEFLISAQDGDGRDLTISNPGPFVIE